MATRFTKAEEAELLEAAKRSGKALREWSREALLREARRADVDPVFTEVLAVRVLLNNALRLLLTGQQLTAEQYQEILNKIRSDKKNVARDIIKQYEKPARASQE